MIHPYVLGFLFKEALINFKRAGIMSYASIGVITTTLLILGIFLLGIVNLNALERTLIKRTSIIAYLKDDIEVKQIEKLQTGIGEQIEYVSEVVYVSKEEAIERFKKELGNQKDILSEVVGNPLPAFFEIKLRKDNTQFIWDKLEKIAAQIRELDGIEDVDYGARVVNVVSNIAHMLRLFIVGLGFVMGLATLIIISNTIELALFARQEEIEIMKLVGATSWFIRIPYLLEGIIHGLISGILSIGILWCIYRIVILKIWSADYIPLLLPTIEFMPWQMMCAMVGISGILGYFGSMVSLHYFLKPKRE
jgi:cell division transport system permease protein